RRDLFHRIAEVTIQVPPLRERKGDVDVLLSHFLELYRGDRRIRLARETLTILRSYPFPGNVRELQNLLNAAFIELEGETIFPHQLPVRSMGACLTAGDGNAPNTAPAPKNESGRSHEELFLELRRSLPENWLELGHRDARQYYEQAFDRVYLRYLIE